jgi:hypothetical protein
MDNFEHFGVMTLSQTTLVLMFLSQVIKSYRTSSSFAKEWLKEKPSRYWKRITNNIGRRAYHSTGWKQKIFLLLNILSLALLITAKTIVNLTGSMLWDVRALIKVWTVTFINANIQVADMALSLSNLGHTEADIKSVIYPTIRRRIRHQ